MNNPDFINNLYPVILGTGNGDQPLILDAARIGIGTTTPDSKLAVNGTIHSKEVKVDILNGQIMSLKKNTICQHFKKLKNTLKKKDI